jgi:thiol-disulfide isomerase/thioredoxin
MSICAESATRSGITMTAMTNYACTECGQVIFSSSQIVEQRRLWDLGEYRSEVILLDGAKLGALRRYDTSLHEGWYCCRFIVMRMTTDKFGTGDKLIVYADSVKPAGAAPVAPAFRAVKLTRDDFDEVLARPEVAGDLAVVKLGAIWCPPCRLMDAAIAKLGPIDGVHFFDVDVDEEQELASRFATTSVPLTLFVHRGRVLRAISGGMTSKMLASEIAGMRVAA